MAPRAQFVRRGDAHLAYQVFGDGPGQILYLLGSASHLEQMWQFPIAVRANERLGRLGRVAVYDWRGYGMSDALPPGGYPIDELAADALAVADAVGFDHPVVLGDTTGGAVAVWVAVHRPERVDRLVLVDAFASLREHPGYDIGFGEAEVADRRNLFQQIWGTGATIALLAPSLAEDQRMVEEWARYERVVATPSSMGIAFDVANAVDVRDLLSQVTQPTLIIHSATNALAPVAHGRYLAQHIPGARYLENDNDAVFEWTTPEIAADLAEFITGHRASAHTTRTLKVVHFADIVNSTDRAAAMGDDAWRSLLTDFRGAVRDVLEHFEAQEVNTRGDDFFVVAASPTIGVETARLIRSSAHQLGLEVRCGLHLGEVEQYADDYAGLAVHIGARVAALAEPGEILASQTVHDALIGSPITSTSRGPRTLKGVPGDWHLYSITN